MKEVDKFSCFRCKHCDCQKLCKRIAQTGAIISCTEITDIVSEILEKNLDDEDWK